MDCSVVVANRVLSTYSTPWKHTPCSHRVRLQHIAMGHREENDIMMLTYLCSTRMFNTIIERAITDCHFRTFPVVSFVFFLWYPARAVIIFFTHGVCLVTECFGVIPNDHHRVADAGDRSCSILILRGCNSLYLLYDITRKFKIRDLSWLLWASSISRLWFVVRIVRLMLLPCPFVLALPGFFVCKPTGRLVSTVALTNILGNENVFYQILERRYSTVVPLRSGRTCGVRVRRPR
jgi:hypothetical protein